MPVNHSITDGSIYLDLLSNVFYEFNNGKWESIGVLNTGDTLD